VKVSGAGGGQRSSACGSRVRYGEGQQVVTGRCYKVSGRRLEAMMLVLAEETKGEPEKCERRRGRRRVERRRRGAATQPMTSVTSGKARGVSGTDGMRGISGSEERKKERRERAADRRGGNRGEDRPERHYD
jgi:hypothetical protein